MNNESMEQLEQLVSKLIDRQLSTSEATRLNKLLVESPEALERYHELLDNHEALCAIYPGDVYQSSLDAGELTVQEAVRRPAANRWSRNIWRRWVLAASLMVAVGLAGYFLGRGRDISTTLVSDGGKMDQTEIGDEQTIAGHATLRRAVGVQWSGSDASFREGDILPDGMLQFDDGVAEIDFFCGATLIVEGPATLDLESDWSVRVIEGRLRANVPPAARGFIVKAAGSEIIDLGTEFALEVGSENVRVQVIDGEVKLRGGAHDGDHLVTGQRQMLMGTADRPEAFEGLSNVTDLQRLSADAEAQRFEEWKNASQQLREDERLIAYFPIAEAQEPRDIRNAASTGNRFDGKLLGPVGLASGRFGAESSGFEFERPGARVRTRIDGDFQAFTFACWARIDSLDHRYNALFMGDGYENGEPHWQIRDDGRLMFSLMVDDTQEVRYGNIRDAGLHHVYFSNPVWDVSMSGQWIHIAAVYDPEHRRVAQYVDGEQVSSEEITDKFFVKQLRIGPAEIGNWGQPFRKTPWFAVRNLNGTIDELAIFNAALEPEEIEDLFEKGKPLGF